MNGARALRREEGRAAILAAAASAIARHGYHGMSMRDLAKDTGRGLASFYVYFASKEDILFALQSEAFDALLDGARHATAGAEDPEARLFAFILAHLRFFAAHPDLLRVLVQEAGALPPEKRALIRARKNAYFATLRAILEAIGARGRGAPDAIAAPAARDLDAATYAVFGMLNWVYGWYDPREHGAPEALAETFHRIALRGVSP